MTGNKKLIYAALFAALCCVITMYPKFPTLFGYIHAGDALVLLAAYVLGPLWGSLAAALGSSLADLMAGYVQYFPGTL
ncbi:MAG: ECF transporter S component [Oscillospiraceae bacterium]